jgi:hypothetical protein
MACSLAQSESQLREHSEQVSSEQPGTGELESVNLKTANRQTGSKSSEQQTATAKPPMSDKR